MVDLESLRPGQKVRIVKPDSFKDNDHLSWVPDMDSYDGKIVTVKTVIHEFGGVVLVEGSELYTWHPNWLEYCFPEDDFQVANYESSLSLLYGGGYSG